MSDNSHIQWTSATWNFVTGCTRVSEGCLRCYIDRQPPFRMAHNRFDSPEVGGSTRMLLHPERINTPLHWRNPRRVFMNSLSDVFHKDVPTELIARAFSVMARTPHHTYQLLTKRHARMRTILGGDGQLLLEALTDETEAQALYDAPWPLPNVHVGVSVESQQWADVRVPALLDADAEVRFISAEPLLGPVTLFERGHAGHERDDLGNCEYICLDCSTDDRDVPWFTVEHPGVGGGGIDWVIVGGESGPGARRMEIEWARSLVEQCRTASVPVFVKQMGSVWAKATGALDRKGGSPEEWPEDLRIREYPRESESVAA